MLSLVVVVGHKFPQGDTRRQGGRGGNWNINDTNLCLMVKLQRESVRKANAIFISALSIFSSVFTVWEFRS
jgi:hypothetical protein